MRRQQLVEVEKKKSKMLTRGAVITEFASPEAYAGQNPYKLTCEKTCQYKASLN